jgi:hypothetical protein
MPPANRLDSIRRFGKRMETTPAVKEIWKKWGMELDSEPKKFTGRLLAPEKIFLKREVSYGVDNADWDFGEFKIFLAAST